MEKRRLSKILAKADAAQVRQMAEKIRKQYEVTVIKAPEKSLTMIKMRRPCERNLILSGGSHRLRSHCVSGWHKRHGGHHGG